MTTAVQIPPCPKCGGERYNLTEPGEPPIIECAGCGAMSCCRRRTTTNTHEFRL
jgi:uncharacterized Zn finger protein